MKKITSLVAILLFQTLSFPVYSYNTRCSVEAIFQQKIMTGITNIEKQLQVKVLSKSEIVKLEKDLKELRSQLSESMAYTAQHCM